MKKRKLVFLLVLILYICRFASSDAISEKERGAGILITSHRGSSFDAPENTFAALELAVAQGADAAEIDVQATKDGVVVLLHDTCLSRTTGVKRNVWELTYEELLTLDGGSWFSSGYAGTPIPSLAEVFHKFKGRLKFNIELKHNGENPTLAEDVLELIKRYQMEGQVVISTAQYEYLVRVKELNSAIPTGFILTGTYGKYLADDNIDFFSMEYGTVTPVLVERVHRQGKEIHVWTVNSEEGLRRMQQMGVDNIISDRPLFARRVLYGAVTE